MATTKDTSLQNEIADLKAAIEQKQTEHRSIQKGLKAVSSTTPDAAIVAVMQSHLKTVDQEIARLEAQVARKSERSIDTGQKVIVGGTLIMLARKNAGSRKALIDILTKYVTREADVKRIRPLIEELKNLETATAPPEKTAAVAAGQK